MTQKKHKLLVVSGGGVKGLGPAMILERLSDIAGKPITSMFTSMSGTSIGGIITASLAVGKNGTPIYTPNNVTEMLMTEARNIFPHNEGGSLLTRALHGITSAKYSRKGLDEVIDKNLGGYHLLDTVVPFTTISYALELDHPRIWSSCRAKLDPNYNYNVTDAVKATSAAPTYFEPHRSETPMGVYHDIDGGIFANTPIFATLHELARCNAAPILNNQVLVLSLGTGEFEPQQFQAKFYHKYGALDWLLSHGLIEKIMKGAEMSEVITAASVYKVIRIDPKLPQEFSKMDNGSPEHMQKFKNIMESTIDNMLPFLTNIARCLSDDDEEACEMAVSYSTLNYQRDFKYTVLANDNEVIESGKHEFVGDL